MSNAEPAAPKQRRVIGTPFPKGVSGNPAGRAKGSRNRLSESFVSDLKNAWDQYGTTALRRCALEEPATFVRVVAGLMPKDINLCVEISHACGQEVSSLVLSK